MCVYIHILCMCVYVLSMCVYLTLRKAYLCPGYGKLFFMFQFRNSFSKMPFLSTSFISPSQKTEHCLLSNITPTSLCL